MMSDLKFSAIDWSCTIVTHSMLLKKITFLIDYGMSA